MKHRNDNESGNLPQTPSALGLDTLCVCGELEIYHNTFPGEDGRCTVLGSTCRMFTPARKPAQMEQSSLGLEIGTVIEYRDDETDELMIGTIIDYGAPGWYDVAHNGRPEDDCGLHESLVVRVVAWEEYLEMMDKEAA